MTAYKCLLFMILAIFILSEDTKINPQNTETCDSSSEEAPELKKSKKEEDLNELNKEEYNQNNNKNIKERKNIRKKHRKEKKEEKIPIYSDIFINQSLSEENNKTSEENSLFFDFRINKKISKFIGKHGITPYPKERFLGKQQGNFLHFFHLAYEKKLPLFFSVDQILYPYIEITKELQRAVMEKGLYNILLQFLKKVIDYGKKEKYEQGIILYFSIALKFLNKKEIVEHDDVCEKLVNKLLDINEKDNNNLYYNFTLLNNIRKIDKLSFIQKYPILKGNENLESMSDCFRFFQNFEFIIEKELFTIYRIGNLIYKSGEEKTYREIKKFIKYIFNEEENVMNPLDIYLFISKNYKNDSSSNEAINNLYDTIKDIIIKEPSLKFISNYTFINKKEEEEFLKERNSYVSLFSYSYTIDEYINYKLINYRKKRFYPSFFEFAEIAHHGKCMRQTIFDRYKGKNTLYNDKLLKFRDGIDFSEEFNYTRKALKQSINSEKYTWIDSYENSFNYLLNIIGHNHKKINNKNMQTKIFNTLIGGYTHFKKDILLFEQNTNITYCKNGEIIDIYFDPQKKFYEEIHKISLVFQTHLLDLINCLKDKVIKIDLEQLIEKKMKRLFISYENILKGIELQENNINDEERIRIKDSMFYYDNRKNQYQGWYPDLYKNQTEKINFELNIYAHNYFMAKPISKIDFKGAIVYTAMNYPEFGLISIEDKENKDKKLFIFSSYTGNEYPHSWTDKINYEGLKELIIGRR